LAYKISSTVVPPGKEAYHRELQAKAEQADGAKAALEALQAEHEALEDT